MVLVMVGLIAVAVVLVVAVRWLNSDWFGTLGSLDIESPETKHFEQTGSMPRSTKLECSVFRLHHRSHLHTGEAFPSTFEDGPWKWSEPQRYAPAVHVAGHFFALDPRGATAEARYYEIDERDRVLLEAEVVLDDVLDLRFEPNVREVLAEVVEGGPLALTSWLRALVHEDRGGNVLTDEIGMWAQAKGYKGILFFGARSIAEHRSAFAGGDSQLGIPVVGGIFDDLRKDPTATNLVALSGVELTRSIRRYRADGSPWSVNAFFGVDEEMVDAHLTHTSADRRHRIGNTLRIAGQRNLSIASDGQIQDHPD